MLKAMGGHVLAQGERVGTYQKNPSRRTTMNKREFLRTMGGASLGLLLGDRLWAQYAEVPPVVLARDEPFWAAIRETYLLKPDYINLENGYFSMQSQPVLEAFIARVREINREASYYMRTTQYDDKLAVRKQLAAMGGCSHEELIITRNTTESLDTVISGIDWKAGDEAVMAAQDYGAMLDMFALQAKRYGVVNRIVSLPIDPQSDDEIVQLYERAITPKTRLLMICHMVNITGHILPVNKVADMAHRHGVEVMVDGAHTFAQLDFRIPDLGGDYFGASLHKWLGTPLGAGLLYVRADKIAKLWPVYADSSVADTDIRKLNHTGTHPVHTDLAIANAIFRNKWFAMDSNRARPADLPACASHSGFGKKLTFFLTLNASRFLTPTMVCTKMPSHAFSAARISRMPVSMVSADSSAVECSVTNTCRCRFLC